MKKYDSSLYPFTSRWVEINGNKIHYIDEGEGDVILFCHPSLTSSFMYRNIIKSLRHKYRCVAIDFPGFGLSQMSPNYSHSISSQAAIIDAFIEKLEYKDITLMMQELGGHAAMKVFIDKPHLLKSILVTDTIIFPVSQYPKIGKMLRMVNGRIFNFLNTNFNFMVFATTNFGIRNRKLSKAEKAQYKELFADKNMRRVITSMLYELVTEEGLLKSIQNAFETTFNNMPMLLIYGSKDPLVEFEIPQRINKLVPDSKLIWIEGEAHFPHEGAPEEMAQHIGNFLKQQSEVLA